MGNWDKMLYGVDTCEKYKTIPATLPRNVTFFKKSWDDRIKFEKPIGLIFYDADHSEKETRRFMVECFKHLPMTKRGVLVLDDWDRDSVREGAFRSGEKWTLLREMPEYTNGLTCPPNHFGYYFGVSVWGWEK
jgi:hypothetical protein